MALNQSSNLSTTESADLSPATLNENRIEFWLLLVLQLLSVPCYLHVLYRFAHNRQLRQSRSNRVIFVLLAVSFVFVTIALPPTQLYLYIGYVYPANDLFCSVWSWFHYSLNIINLFLMVFASIERHWLIFHPQLMANRAGKFCLHYGPLGFCILFPPMFYLGAIFIHRCDTSYDFSQLLCAYPCYFYSLTWSLFDLYVNNLLPIFTIPIACTILYVRVMLQKRTMRQQAFKWSRDRKMILQLWAISSLYLAMWMPLQLLWLINLYWNPTFLLEEQVKYLYLFPYLIHLVCPFIVLFTYRHEMIPVRLKNCTAKVHVVEVRNRR